MGEDSIKDPEMYEGLRADGASKQKAARISNAAANNGRSAVGRKGGAAESYEKWTVDELRERAGELDIADRSTMTKEQLINSLRDS